MAHSETNNELIKRKLFDILESRELSSVELDNATAQSDWLNLASEVDLKLIVTGIQERFGVTLKPLDLLSKSSFGELANYIEERQSVAGIAVADVGSASKLVAPDLQTNTAVSEDSDDGSTVYRASPSQENLWLIDQIDGGSTAYNLSTALRTSIPLDTMRLKESLEYVVDRHEALRTHFEEKDGVLFQRIEASARFDWHVTQVHPGEHRTEGEDRLGEMMREFASKPFDLSTGPLLRCAVYVLDDADCVIQFVIHHSVSDGWSQAVLLRETFERYTCGPDVDSNVIPAVALPRSYVEFSKEQRHLVSSKMSHEFTEYWQKQLGNLPVVNSLPTDRARPPVQSFTGGRVERIIPRDVIEKIEMVGRQSRSTLYMTLLAAFKVLIFQYSKETDICVGTPVANRSKKEFENTVGFFVNTVAMRSILSPSASFTTLLNSVRDLVLDAIKYQEVPFDQVVEAVNPPRSLAHAPLFQILFEFQDKFGGETDLSALGFDRFFHETGTSKYDLSLEISNNHADLVCELEFASDLFDRATAERLLSHFETLLGSISADPNCSIDELGMLPPSEYEEVVTLNNRTDCEIEKSVRVQDLFSRRVSETPQAIAISCGAHSLTFSEIDEKSDILAVWLLQNGVARGSHVALCLDRSAEMVVAILAILKTGAAYVPIDPKFPKQRQEFILQDSAATVLLTEQAYLPRFINKNSPSILCLDTDWPDAAEIHTGSSRNSLDVKAFIESKQGEVSAQGDECAYVIYTSGSTGQPKGVIVSHRNVVNLLQLLQETYPLEPGGKYLLKTNFVFDVSVSEIFAWFSGKGSLDVLPKGLEASPDLIADHIISNDITHINFSPTLLRYFLQEVSKSPTFKTRHNLQYVLVCGEAFPTDLIATAIDQFGEAKTINLYGPTEATVFSTAWTIRRSLPSVNTPIGKPLPNYRAYVVDHKLMPVPIGVPGELCLAGEGLARGYLNRPDLTSERFVDSPIDPGLKLYRTGDVVRWLADGNLEYLGRNDFQVKVRGVRIEPAEIEAAMLATGRIKQALVRLETPSIGEEQLVAYALPKSQEGELGTVQSDDLVEYLFTELRCVLPEFQAPHLIEIRDSFPLNAAGKIDRKQIPNIAGFKRLKRTKSEFVRPESELEKLILLIWQDVLGIEDIGVTDNFFALGGDSILSIQVASKARDREIALSARQVFQFQTIRELAISLNQTSQNNSNGSLSATSVKANEGALSDPAPFDLSLMEIGSEELSRLREKYDDLQYLYPVTGMQLGMYFHSIMPGQQTAYTNQCFVGFDSSFDHKRFRRAVDILVKRHDILRTALVGFDRDWPLQLVTEKAVVPYRKFDHREFDVDTASQAFEAILAEDRNQLFNFEKPPLMRMAHILEPNDRHRILWTYHHAILDGWSMSLLWDELAAIYSALEDGGRPSLPSTRQFRDVVSWRKSKETTSVKKFWKDEFADSDPCPELSIAQDGLVPESGSPAALHLELDEVFVGRLNATARRHHVTLSTLFHLAFSVVLAADTGNDTAIFGVTVSGRAIELPGVDRVVGPLINTIPVKVHLELAKGIGEFLREAQREQADREANSNIDLIDIQRAAGNNRADFNCLMVFENYPSETQSNIAAIGACSYGFSEETHYDLNLMITPGNRIKIDFGFNTTRLHWKDIDKMAQRLNQALDKIANEETTTIAEVAEFSAPAANSKPDVPSFEASMVRRQGKLKLGRDLVHHRIENYARTTPTKCALVYEGKRYSYDELNRSANLLANYLIEQLPELKTDSVIGVCLPRSDKLLITILAIWKAGAAYVPLDPTLPTARIDNMLETSEAVGLITDEDSLSLHSFNIRGNETFLYDAVLNDFDGDYSDPETTVSGGDLAYIIYTSGSTGAPKGAMVEHVGMLNNIVNKVNDFEISSQSRIAQTASQSFDISVWQMFVGLTEGGTTVIYDDRSISNVSNLAAKMTDDKITLVEFVPTYLVLFVEYLENSANPPALSSITHLILTGEAADAHYITRWFSIFPNTKVFNAYGPTEASDDITHHLILPTDHIANPVPIGRTLENFDIYVVDDDLNPVPIGEKGEIVVTGVGVGRGYINMAGATAKAFGDSPFPDRYRNRLYRTGDIGQMGGDGVLLFHGRKDSQVKIRGFRIELGEIEAKLVALPEIRQAAVLDIKRPGREPLLCAFVVLNEEQAKDKILSALHTSLPDYMVPSEMRFLDQMPILVSGKIDRHALRASYSDTPRQASNKPAQTDTEVHLAGLWSEVLGIDPIGVDEDFFDLGGDSFKAIRMATKFGPRLEVVDLYSNPTIEALARHLDENPTNEERLLVQITKPANPRMAVVGISNSGGDPVSFVELGKALEAQEHEIELHAVKLPRTPISSNDTMEAEIDRLAMKLATLIESHIKIPFIVYAQCNGSAFAIRLARELQERCLPVQAICLGGALMRTTHSAPDERNDEEILEFLSSTGSTLPERADEIAFFLDDFRYDCQMADAYYNELLRQLEAEENINLGIPLWCVVGDQDPIVAGYQTSYLDWKLLSSAVRLIEYPNHGHYLLRDCTAELAKTLDELTTTVSAENDEDALAEAEA